MITSKKIPLGHADCAGLSLATLMNFIFYQLYFIKGLPLGAVKG